jgi:hypothetical protein
LLLGLPTTPNACKPEYGCGSERYFVDRFVLRVSNRFRWVVACQVRITRFSF